MVHIKLFQELEEQIPNNISIEIMNKYYDLFRQYIDELCTFLPKLNQHLQNNVCTVVA